MRLLDVVELPLELAVGVALLQGGLVGLGSSGLSHAASDAPGVDLAAQLYVGRHCVRLRLAAGGEADTEVLVLARCDVEGTLRGLACGLW